MKNNNIITINIMQKNIHRAFAENGINIKITRSFIQSWIKEILQNKLLIKQSKVNYLDNFKYGEYKKALSDTLFSLHNSSLKPLNKIATEILMKEVSFVPSYSLGRQKPSYGHFIHKVIGNILLPYVYDKARGKDIN